MFKNINRKANFLLNTRTAKGLSRYQVEKDTGISYSSLFRWEKGETNPQLENFLKLTDYYGVSREKAEEVFNGKVFGDSFLHRLLTSDDVQDLGNWEDMTPEELAEAAYEKGHMRILEELISEKLINVRKFMAEHYEPAIMTESDAGSLTINGVMLPNGYGDATNAIYISTEDNKVPCPIKAYQASIKDKAEIWHHDCRKDYGVSEIEGGMIHVYLVAPTYFVIEINNDWN